MKSKDAQPATKTKEVEVKTTGTPTKGRWTMMNLPRGCAEQISKDPFIRDQVRDANIEIVKKTDRIRILNNKDIFVKKIKVSKDTYILGIGNQEEQEKASFYYIKESVKDSKGSESGPEVVLIPGSRLRSSQMMEGFLKPYADVTTISNVNQAIYDLFEDLLPIEGARSLQYTLQTPYAVFTVSRPITSEAGKKITAKAGKDSQTMRCVGFFSEKNAEEAVKLLKKYGGGGNAFYQKMTQPDQRFPTHVVQKDKGWVGASDPKVETASPENIYPFLSEFEAS